MFGDRCKTKFRPTIPFTEPSAEMDATYFVVCGGEKGYGVCKNSGWIGLLGCGMVTWKF